MFILVALLATTAAGLYALISVVVAHRFTTPRRVAPPMPPAHARGAFGRVAIAARHDAHHLMGWYAPTAQRTAAVILVHGRDACRGDELRASTFDLALSLHGAGMSVLMLDLRGHGESAPSRLTFGQRERRDVLGAVDFLLARGYPAARIGVLGASMGGASVLGAAAEEPAIGAIVSDSAFANLHEVLRLQFTQLTRLPLAFLRGALVVARALTGEHLARVVPLHDVRRLAGRPLLVIHAQDDPFVPVRHAQALAETSGASLWITPGDRHLASFRTEPAEYVDRVRAFFTEHLQVMVAERRHTDVVFAPRIPIAV